MVDARVADVDRRRDVSGNGVQSGHEVGLAGGSAGSDPGKRLPDRRSLRTEVPEPQVPLRVPSGQQSRLSRGFQRARVHGALSDLRFRHQADRDGASFPRSDPAVRPNDLDRLADDRGVGLLDRTSRHSRTPETAGRPAAEGQGGPHRRADAEGRLDDGRGRHFRDHRRRLRLLVGRTRRRPC